MAGFEPTTSRLLSGCSTAKLHWHFANYIFSGMSIYKKTVHSRFQCLY